MNSPHKNKEILFGWCGIVGSVSAIIAAITGHFLLAALPFTFAWWCMYKMQNYKHNQLDRPILCSVVGHQPPVYGEKGWWSPGEEYATVIVGPTDGIGRKHARVEADCARCGEKFIVARIHLPQEKK